MMSMLIGLAGPARSGKDTAGNLLVERFGLDRLALADPIKRGVQAMLGLDADVMESDKESIIPWLGVSYRQLCQTLGTEWGRDRVAPDLWLRVADRAVKRYRAACAYRDDTRMGGVLVTDVRFDNEADWIRSRGGLVLHIQRDDRPAVHAHASEQGVTAKPGDLIVPNNGTISELDARLAGAVEHYRRVCAARMSA